MGEPTPPQPAAGWYPDPSGTPGQQRYFDGVNWGPTAPPPPGSRATAPYSPSAPYGNVATNEPRFTIHYGFALLAIFSLIGTLLIGIAMLGAAGGSGDPDAGGIAGGMAVLWFLWGGMWTLIWTAFAVYHTLGGKRR